MDSHRAKGDGAQGAELGTDTEKQEQGNGGREIQRIKVLKVQAWVSHFTQGPDTCPEVKLLHKVHLTL